MIQKFLIKFFFTQRRFIRSGPLNIIKNQSNEIYNFADQDHVGWSYDIPSYSFKTTALSVIDIFEILRKLNKKIKFFSTNIIQYIWRNKKVKQMKNNPRAK